VEVAAIGRRGLTAALALVAHRPRPL